MRIRPQPRLLPALVALLLVFAFDTPVAAAEIPQLRAPVTDLTGSLSGREDEVERAIEDLLDERNIQLFVLFVPTTDELTVTEFADETARRNSLGGNDALLVVAIEDRSVAIWRSEALTKAISDAELDGIVANEVERRLVAGDFAGAAVAAAEGLAQAAVAAEPTEAPLPDGGTTTPPRDGGVVPLLLAVLLLGAGAYLVIRWWSARGASRREAEERDRRTGRLAREANALLVQTDERIRNAQQETGFVEAEWGEDEVTPLREAIAEAQSEMREAFAIRQKVDDAEPEDPPTREAMLNEIVARARRAQAALDRETERIQRLRDLERDAPAILDRLPGEIAAVEGRLPAAEAAMADLGGYAESAWAPVRGNIAEARKGLQGARAAVERGRGALAGDDRRVAARQAHTAQEGVAGAAALVDAIEKLLTTVRDAERRWPEELAAAEADLAEARRGAAGGSPEALRPRLDAAEEALRRARTVPTGRGSDPIAALRAATAAHAAADEALAAVRADAEQRARFAAALDASLATAAADLDVASDFIAARRSGVGRRARTRLAEADRLLAHAHALRGQDPAAALEAARRAERLAEEAYGLAASDFDEWNMRGPGMGGGRGAGSDMAGAILGGILGGILSGGGRGGGGGWGGSPWGSSGPFGGGGGWGGGGGFGGGGGGFGGGGGGGGGSRGGRW